jgi:hypothetical protein
VAFIAGSPWYKKPPPKENIFAEVFKVISVNTKNFGATTQHGATHVKKFSNFFWK